MQWDESIEKVRNAGISLVLSPSMFYTFDGYGFLSQTEMRGVTVPLATQLNRRRKTLRGD